MRRLLILTLICAAVAGEISAQNWESYGLKYSGESKDSGKIETLVETPGKGFIPIISDATLDSQQINLIGRTFQTFFNWNELNIESAQLIFEGRKLSILIKLDQFIHNGEDISVYMPSGIQFYYETFYEYDFRMFKDGLFMRLKGQYYSKEEFLDELYNAVSDPMLYIQIHDPSYVIRQIDELRSENHEQDMNFTALKESHEKLTKEYITLLEMHNNLLNEYKTQVENRNIADEKLKNGIISLGDKSFFGALKEFDADALNTIIEMKKANPAYSIKDIQTALKTKGIKVTNKLIEGVFIIYFYEFPQNVE